jgi:hypothetical protein
MEPGRRLLQRAIPIRKGWSDDGDGDATSSSTSHSGHRHRRTNEQQQQQQTYEYYSWQDQYIYDNQYALYNLPDLYIQYTGCSSFMAPDNGDRQRNNQNDVDDAAQQQQQWYNVNGEQMEQYNYNNANNNNNNNNGNNNRHRHRRRTQQYNNANGAYGWYQDDNHQENEQEAEQQQEDADQNAAANDGMYLQNMVRFTLCSSEDCGDCSGEYAVDMFDFLNTYTEMTMEERAYKCEYVRERCYCNNNGQDCLSSCYAAAGLDDCMTEYYGGEAFQLQEYLECKGKCSFATQNK